MGSQLTLSRFENAVGPADLYRLGTALADAVLTYHRERLGQEVRLVMLDLDATDEPHPRSAGVALFNGYYETWCYLPLIATVTFDTERIQHGVAARLRVRADAGLPSQAPGLPRCGRGGVCAGLDWQPAAGRARAAAARPDAPAGPEHGRRRRCMAKRGTPSGADVPRTRQILRNCS